MFLIVVTMFSSCQSKMGTINDLRELRTEIRVNGGRYDSGDWNDFEAKYAEIIEELEMYELTDQESMLVEKLHAEILRYKIKYELTDAVGGVVSNISQAIDDAIGLNTSGYAQTLADSASDVEHQIVKQTKRVFWSRIAWIIGGILFLGLLWLITVSLNTGRKRSARRSRHVRRR